jgi:hypothetical protein
MRSAKTKLKQVARDARTALRGSLIAPQITGDSFYAALSSVAADPRVRTILEIGASSGEGSTEAIIEGARRNPSKPVIHCIEVSPPRYRALAKRHRNLDFLTAHNVSSVAVERFADESRIRQFHETVDSPIKEFPLSMVLGWYRADIKTVLRNALSQDGIRMIKEREGIDAFDMVLIDGSEFTGSAELDDAYGARFVLLDDILTFKNYDNYARLNADPSYELIECSKESRNGYALFRRTVDRPPSTP